MENINIIKDHSGYDKVFISTAEGTFIISFQNNLDLYWSYYSKNLFDEEVKEFTITKENTYLFNLFEKLYNSIMLNMPFYNYPGELSDEERNKRLSYHNPEELKLVQDNEICWHSDDSYYDASSILKITKSDETFKVKFYRSKIDNEECTFPTFTIRFRNSGSRYDPFNISFMNMYKSLLEYDYQIYLEDIIYENKRIKRL